MVDDVFVVYSLVGVVMVYDFFYEYFDVGLKEKIFMKIVNVIKEFYERFFKFVWGL